MPEISALGLLLLHVTLKSSRCQGCNHNWVGPHDFVKGGVLLVSGDQRSMQRFGNLAGRAGVILHIRMQYRRTMTGDSLFTSRPVDETQVSMTDRLPDGALS